MCVPVCLCVFQASPLPPSPSPPPAPPPCQVKDSLVCPAAVLVSTARHLFSAQPCFPYLTYTCHSIPQLHLYCELFIFLHFCLVMIVIHVLSFAKLSTFSQFSSRFQPLHISVRFVSRFLHFQHLYIFLRVIIFPFSLS